MTGELVGFGLGIIVGAGIIAIVAAVAADRYFRGRR